ncbi:MAG: thiol-disulfide oxidoreductase DCC family protein [Phycisphaerales bacterium JB040]
MHAPRTPSQHAFEIFIDAGCGLCSREARFMAWLDRRRPPQRLRLTDIGSRAFQTVCDETGLDFDTAMRSIHGRILTGDRAGELVEGNEVFRRAYGAIGKLWGGLWAPTGWPVLRPICDRLYALFARRRYRRRMKAGCPMPTEPRFG